MRRHAGRPTRAYAGTRHDRHINNHDTLRWHFNSATWHNLVTIQLLKFHFRWPSGARRNHYPLSLWRNGGVMVTLCDLSNGLRLLLVKVKWRLSSCSLLLELIRHSCSSSPSWFAICFCVRQSKVTRCHGLSVNPVWVCTGQSSHTERASAEWQSSAGTPQFNPSFSFVPRFSKHLI